MIIFEHNPYNPLTRKMVNTCPFDTDAVLLYKKELNSLFLKNRFDIYKSGYCFFVPPKLKFLNFLENYFRKIAIGGQYFSIFKK